MWAKSLALIAGLFFGLGLGISQMIDRERVLSFLDVAGNWDPTLAFVMGGAVLVTIISFRWVLRRSHPLLAEKFYLPSTTQIDRPLLIGAGLFGIGWGIAGYCPGPAVTATVLGVANPFIFLAAMLSGSLLCKQMIEKKAIANLAQPPSPTSDSTVP